MSVTVPRTGPAAFTARSAPPFGRSLATVVRRGLRDNRRAPLTWGGALGGMSALMAAIWPSIEDSISKVVKSYPSGLKEAFGIQQLDTVEQYIDAEMLSLIVPVALAFFAVRCITRPTVGAEEQGHLDTVLSQPLSRRVLVAGSSVVTAIGLAEILLVVWALTWVTGSAVGAGASATTLAAGFVNVWPLAMAFAGLAAALAGVMHRPAPVTAVAMGALAAMYLVDLAGKLADPVGPLRAVSAFRYYGSAVQHGLDASHVILLSLVGIALTAVGAALFARRDVL
jgi:ABC-2 type transport system permease protein